jgi:fructose/tagatose bisphosphate aldolase
MPVADFKTFCAILERARAGRFALPAVNVTSMTTANAVLRGLAESKADGIIQISTGGGAFASVPRSRTWRSAQHRSPNTSIAWPIVIRFTWRCTPIIA